MRKLAIVPALILSVALAACGGSQPAPAPAPEAPAAEAPAAEAPAAEAPAAEAPAAEAPAPERTLKMAYSVQNLANTYFVEVAAGVEERAKELGIEITIHDGKSDPALQVSAVENFISKGVDAIMVSPVDPVALEPLVERAHEAGIVFLSCNQEIAGSDGLVTIPEYEYGFTIGEHAGQWIAERMAGAAKVAVFDYPEIEVIIERANGMIDGIKAHAPDAEFVAQQSANNPDKGMRAMEAILQKNPDVNVLVAVNDAGALGGYEAIMAAGNVNPDFYIGGLDAAPEALDKIREGGIYRATVDIAPFASGKLFIDTCIDIMENGPLSDIVVFPKRVVSSENIEEYFE